MSDKEQASTYGYCPKCGAAGVAMERSPNGNTQCANGHRFPHAQFRAALAVQPVAQAPELTDDQINEIWSAKDKPAHKSSLSPFGLERIRAIIAAAAPSPEASKPVQAEAPSVVFESPTAKALERAWRDGWNCCRDAEFIGEEAQNDAFNGSYTLGECINADQAIQSKYLIRARWPDGIETYLEVRGVHDLGEKIGIDVDAPEGHPLATPPAPATVQAEAPSHIDLFKWASEWSKKTGHEFGANTADLLGWLTGSLSAALETHPPAPCGAVEREALVQRIRGIALTFHSALEKASQQTYREDIEPAARRAREAFDAELRAALASGKGDSA